MNYVPDSGFNSDPPPKDFYEVGGEYYPLGPDGKPLPVMVTVTGHVTLVQDPRTGSFIWAQPTSTTMEFQGEYFTIFATKGNLTPARRPSGEARIFAEFYK